MSREAAHRPSVHQRDAYLKVEIPNSTSRARNERGATAAQFNPPFAARSQLLPRAANAY
jgi:hypothetical protein